MEYYPRVINPAETFNSIVEWFKTQKAPKYLVGISGTDSIVAFLAAHKAFPGKVKGVHFAPSKELLENYPDLKSHLWFSERIIPWLKNQAFESEITIDTSINFICDGLRWGRLMDMSVGDIVFDRFSMRGSEDTYWVVGTRNRTEDELYNYSNASMAASIQPLIHLWKSEVLEIAKYLGVPELAIDKSCEMDCACGRMRFPAQHIRELDCLLMARTGELSLKHTGIDPKTAQKLEKFIDEQIMSQGFKKKIPYLPEWFTVKTYLKDSEVLRFEYGSMDLKTFNHRKHAYIAWCYLKSMPFDDALKRYSNHLYTLLSKNKRENKFSQEITRSYFVKIQNQMEAFPGASFDLIMDELELDYGI